MSTGRIQVPTHDEFFSLLKSYERRLSALERRDKRPTSVAFVGTNEIGFTVTTDTERKLAIREFAIPEWATNALLHVTVGMTVQNTRPVLDFGYLKVFLDGGFVGRLFAGFQPGEWGHVSASAGRNINVDGTQDIPIEVGAVLNSQDGNWSAQAPNKVEMHASCVFVSTPGAEGEPRG